MSFNQDSVIFKQKLYQNFKQSGLLARLQTTLRVNLLEKIQKPNFENQKDAQNIQKAQSSKPFHLRKKFLLNIIHNYLQKQQMEYTLSIFTPECNLAQKDIINFNTLSEILNFPKKQQNLLDSQSFLQCLIDQWYKRNCSQKRQRSIQTDIEGETVGKKLERIQKDYLAKIDYWKLIPNRQISENPTLYEHQTKLKAQFQVEKEKVKLDAQRVIKAQMQRKFQSQYQFRLNQITKQHEKRIQQLKAREKQIMQSLQRKKSQLQTRSKQLSTKQYDLIQKYQTREKQIQAFYKKRQADLQNKEKQFWKKQLQLKAKKREYEDTIRLVKQKAIGQAGEMPGEKYSNFNQVNSYTGKSSFYH